MNNTQHYNLLKPDQEDHYEVNIFNQNADTLDTAIYGKVDKVSGKGLSANDYTTNEKNKLAASGYGTCTTPAGTEAKTCDIPGFVLIPGATVGVTFINGNEHTAPTLNVSGTGEKNIYYNGVFVSPEIIKQNMLALLQYDGTQWVLINPAALDIVYYCTGTNDDLTIQGIINNFFDNSAKMAMSLRIIGTTHTLQAAPANGIHMHITSPNTRGATVYLDCTDWEIVPVVDGKRFMSGVNANLVIDGLRLRAMNISEAQICLILAKNLYIRTRNKIIIQSGDGSCASAGTTLQIGTDNHLEVIEGYWARNCLVIVGDRNVLSGARSLSFLDGSSVGNNNTISSINLSGCTMKIGGYNEIRSITISNGSRLYLGDGNKVLEGIRYYIVNGDYIYVYIGNNCHINEGIQSLVAAGLGNITMSIGPGTVVEAATTPAIRIYSGMSATITAIGATIFSRATGGDNENAVAVLFENANTNSFVTLKGCALFGYYRAVNQTSAANTVRWHIDGNRYGEGGFYVNGELLTQGYDKTNERMYFKAYSNRKTLSAPPSV